MKRALILASLSLGLIACAVGAPEVLVGTQAAAPQYASLGTPQPSQGKTRIVVGAIGEPAAHRWPEFELVVNGRTVGAATVEAPHLTRYVFETDLARGEIREIRVRYTNDTEFLDAAGIRVADRNLYVYYVEVDGTGTSSRIGTRFVRIDGMEIPGDEPMYWNGDLIFPVAGRFRT